MTFDASLIKMTMIGATCAICSYVFIQLVLSRYDKKQLKIYSQIKPPAYHCLFLPSAMVAFIMIVIRVGTARYFPIGISQVWFYFNCVLISVTCFYVLSRLACIERMRTRADIEDIKKHNRWFNPLGGSF